MTWPPIADLSRWVEDMFFYTDARIYTTPAALGLTAEDVFFPTADGNRLHAWFLPASGPPLGAVLHLHGNAANISNHLPLVDWLPARGYHVLMVDYRGFGRSEGRPTLNGVVEDSIAALDYLRARDGVDPARVALLGQSIGGATAIRVAAQRPGAVRALVVDCAFSSYRGIARIVAEANPVLRQLAPIGVRVLPGPDRDPVTAIRALTMPLFLIHGTDDEVIPFSEGKALDAAAPQPHTFLAIEGGLHVDALNSPSVRDRVDAFLRSAFV
jgi:hypothetical protein